MHTQGSSSYNLILYCRYADENGKTYNTDTQFSKMKPPTELEELGKEQLGKKVELIIGDGTWCVAQRDIGWKFAVYGVLFNIVFPVIGVTIVIIRIIFEKRKSKRDKTEQVI